VNFFLKNNKVILIYLFIVGCFFVSLNINAQQQLTAAQNLEAELLKHQGKVIYLDFWASWCGPCRRSFPWMNQVQNKYVDQGFTVISVNLDTEFELAKKFLEHTPANFPVVYDPQGLLAKKYELLGMPSSFLIGKDGQVKRTHVGFFTKNQPTYEHEIKTLIENKVLSSAH